MTKRSADERRILAMFSYMRPAGSVAEQNFVDKFLTPLGFQRDPYKNLILQIGDNPNILWSSHLDTVHHYGGRQKLRYDGHVLGVRKSNCLGADCTAGIWLMTEMVKAQVPGVYVIHHAEEEGCIGSKDLATRNPAFFDGIDTAIAFDRYGYQSIITHQMAGKTASDAFAASLADALNMNYEADDGGVYTDTNEYVHLVSECTNISVGYFNQHTSREQQDVPFLIQLRDALISADFTSLVFERDLDDTGYSGSWKYNWDNLRKYDGMEGIVRAYPALIAELLESYGVNEYDLEDAIDQYYGEAVA